MLELRPNCDRCGRGLPAASAEARICSFECTFCSSCAEQVLGGRCPNCGGELTPRPRRPEKSTVIPPSATRGPIPVNAGRLEMLRKRFERPDEVREMALGRFELVRIGGMTIGRAT